MNCGGQYRVFLAEQRESGREGNVNPSKPGGQIAPQMEQKNVPRRP